MPTPVRILYFINSMGAGGAERQLVYLLGGLDRARFSPRVLSILDAADQPFHYKDALIRLNVPFSTLSLGTGPRGLAAGILHYSRANWTLRPHIVQGCLHYANLIARIARPICPPHRLITSVRGLYTPSELRTERYTWRLSDHVITNSQFIKHYLTSGAQLPAKAVTVIPNAVSLESFAPQDRPRLRDELLPGARFVALMVARIDPVKDHATLLQAVHVLRDSLPTGFRLLLIGEVSFPDTQRQIEALIKQYQLENYVKQIPVTDDIYPYYAMADVSTLTSISEAFPNVILESFAAGKPVIVSTGANSVGIVQPGETGWQFPTGDALALARCLQEALQTSPVELSRMGERARAVAARYSVPAMAEQYMRLYESLLRRKS
ncbi:MAG: glycosyltransferase [Anaerolineae bacterium]|nr:glycosyltransferase [Anaerolineae bacterium]